MLSANLRDKKSVISTGVGSEMISSSFLYQLVMSSNKCCYGQWFQLIQSVNFNPFVFPAQNLTTNKNLHKNQSCKKCECESLFSPLIDNCCLPIACDCDHLKIFKGSFVTGYLKVRIHIFQAKVNWQASSIRTNMSLTFADITPWTHLL